MSGSMYWACSQLSPVVLEASSLVLKIAKELLHSLCWKRHHCSRNRSKTKVSTKRSAEIACLWSPALSNWQKFSLWKDQCRMVFFLLDILSVPLVVWVPAKQSPSKTKDTMCYAATVFWKKVDLLEICLSDYQFYS